MIEQLDNKNFNDFISGGLKLVEFYAEWCGFCQKQKPILEELTNIIVGTVDVDKNPNLASKYMISGYPTFILFEQGEEAARFSGLHSKYDLINRTMDFIS